MSPLIRTFFACEPNEKAIHPVQYLWKIRPVVFSGDNYRVFWKHYGMHLTYKSEQMALMLERNRSKWLRCVNQRQLKKEFLFKAYGPKENRNSEN